MGLEFKSLIALKIQVHDYRRELRWYREIVSSLSSRLFILEVKFMPSVNLVFTKHNFEATLDDKAMCIKAWILPTDVVA